MKMKDFILPAGGLVGVAFLVVVLVVAESFAAFVIRDFTKVANGVTCTVKTIDTGKNDVALKLDCGGKEAFTKNVKVIISYVQNPGPLTCTTYKSSSASCEPRSKK